MDRFIPSTMSAIQLDEPNGKLTFRQIPVPRPHAGQVLIRMAAAPINPSDLGMLAGDSPTGERKYPFTPGIEGSGTVVAVGTSLMPRLLNRRRVACSSLPSKDGTWAEYMVTSAKLCVPLNKKLTFEQGAMLLVNPLTALAFFEIAQQGNHRSIVSTAAASALGSIILFLGNQRKVPVIHVVRSSSQEDLIHSRGGKYVLNSSNVDFIEQLGRQVDELQATLMLDAIGGHMTQHLADAAPFGSTILLYGRLSDKDVMLDSRVAIHKDLCLMGWYLANWIGKKNLLQVLRLSQQAQNLMATQIKIPIHKRLPLSEAQRGILGYTQKMTAGKILLVANSQEVELDA